MFYAMQVQDHVRVPPSMFGDDLKASIVKAVREQYTGFISKEMVQEHLFPGRYRSMPPGRPCSCCQRQLPASLRSVRNRLPPAQEYPPRAASLPHAAAGEDTICCLCGPPPMIKFACLPVSPC